VLDTGSGTITHTIPVGQVPSDVTITPDGTMAYVANTGDNTVSVLDLGTNTAIAAIPVGLEPGSVAFAVGPLPADAVDAVSPSSGSPLGGNTVTVTGSGFTGATAVHFGATEAASFTVTSDTSLTAVVPAGTAGSTVDVTVTTPQGTSGTSSADRYSYTAADLSVALTALGASGLLGGQIAYTLTGRNNGPSPNDSATSTCHVVTSLLITCS
jgi:YVTN family beta-propeller protein